MQSYDHREFQAGKVSRPSFYSQQSHVWDQVGLPQGSVHLHLGNLQEQKLCSISEQPVPPPVSPCGKHNFLISTVKISSFNLCLLFHVLLPCSTVISLAASTPWHAHSLRGLLSYSMMLCFLQAVEAQVPQPHLTGKFLYSFQSGDQGRFHRVAP